jgi:hypothetical protein
MGAATVTGMDAAATATDAAVTATDVVATATVEAVMATALADMPVADDLDMADVPDIVAAGGLATVVEGPAAR